MKNLKFLALALVAAVFASCDDKPVQYNYDVQDESSIAKYQLYYVVPCASGAANNIYKTVVNGTSYENNGAALLSVYNGIPSGAANIFYTTKPGTTTLNLFKSASLTDVYNNSCSLEAGESTIWVYDFTKAPLVFKETTPPANLQTENDTIAGTALKFYNFMFASVEGGVQTPIDYKIQVCAMRQGGTSTVDEDYLPIGEPIAFGECTEWLVKEFKKTTFNGSGNATLRFGYRKIVNGQDQGWATYTNSAGKETIMRNLTMTGYFGRAYRRFICGVADNKSLAVSVGSLTAR